MTHMVLMKLRDGCFTDEVYFDYCETFDAIARALPEDVLRVRVYRNCVTRDQNMDVLIRMELAGPDSLQKYLNHPLHVAIGSRMNPHVVKIASFDCEE